MAGAFFVGGLVILAVSFAITGTTVLLASFAVGLTFAWKKIPIDTMVQEALPDGYRGRVFAAYDVAYNLARIVAAALAIPMLPHLGRERLGRRGRASCSSCGRRSCPAGSDGRREIVIRFSEGAKAEEWPRALAWGGVEEPVEVVRSWNEERDGVRLRRFRLALQDGSVLDVSRVEPDGTWRIDREAEGGRPDGQAVSCWSA